MPRFLAVLLLAPLLLAPLLLAPLAAHAEVCRFAGTTSYNGRLAVRAEATQADGLLTINVSVEFAIHAWMTDYRYLGEEITTWSPGDGRRAVLRSVAVNGRSLADGGTKRQQWDVFTRHGARLEACRVQARSLADLRQRHPGFVRHWPPADFGQPWLAAAWVSPDHLLQLGLDLHTDWAAGQAILRAEGCQGVPVSPG